MHTNIYPQKKRRLGLFRFINSLVLQHPIIVMMLLAGTYQFGSGVYIFAKARVAQLLIAHAWELTLGDKQHHRPWPWADTYPVAQLQFNKQNWFVLADANGRNLAFAPTHLSSTPVPGGQGSSVILGHRDTHFSGLQHLKEGDTIEVTNMTKQRRYRVDTIRIADAEQLSYWQISDENKAHSTLTLVTCYPFNSLIPNPSQRYTVFAVAIDVGTVSKDSHLS